MEISLLKMLLNNITSFFHLSSREDKKFEPVHKYYVKTEEILKLLKPVLVAIVDSEIASDELLQKSFTGLGRYIDGLRELFVPMHTLMSKVYFVLQVELLIEKIRTSALEILELLKTSDHGLPLELNAASLELHIQKIKHMGFEQTSSIITKAISDQQEGSESSSEDLAKITDHLSLSSNQEILIEAVALEKLKEFAELAENNSEIDYIEQVIALVTLMHDRLVAMKQSQACNPVTIPSDFCCPLSLELMTDPVIVASGQTYERVFIRNWIDLGLTVCPKTRQALSHTNLIPNYTVKALIANWCESNGVKLPDPMKSMDSNQPSTLLASFPRDPLFILRSSSGNSGCGSNLERMSQGSSEGSLTYFGERVTDSGGGNEAEIAAGAPEGLPESYNNDVSGEGMSEAQPVATLRVEPESLARTRMEMRPRSQTMWRRPSERFVPRVVSSTASESRPDLSELEAQVKKLIEDLKGDSVISQREATAELRLLARHNMDNRIVIANCGAITLLVNLLRSSDEKIQENAVTALLNLSINDNNKTVITNVESIDPLIYVLETGTPEAKENAAATLFSLSVIEDNKIKIGRSGAIRSLVDLLGNGTPRGKRDAATALFNLSILHENKARIVEARAVRFLVEMMDPAVGMVDKAVAVLSNLSSIPEGRAAIGQEGGIPVLVDVLELGSTRGKENAAAALLQLCTNSNRFSNVVLQEGAVPPLVALSQSGTARAKEKALGLLSYFRTQRNANGGRD